MTINPHFRRDSYRILQNYSYKNQKLIVQSYCLQKKHVSWCPDDETSRIKHNESLTKKQIGSKCRNAGTFSEHVVLVIEGVLISSDMGFECIFNLALDSAFIERLKEDDSFFVAKCSVCDWDNIESTVESLRAISEAFFQRSKIFYRLQADRGRSNRENWKSMCHF